MPLVLAGNKADLSSEVAYSDEELSRFAATYDAPFLRTSAKTGANVEAAFGRLATAVAERYADLS